MAKSGNYGFSGLNKSQNPQLSGNAFLGNKNTTLFSARVISIVLDENHPRFNDLGGWSALGAIEYDNVENPIYGTVYNVAYPLNANIKNFPLINEIVTIYRGFQSGVKIFENGIPIKNSRHKSYYMNTINVWNTPHHNGYSFITNTVQESQNKSYAQTQAGSLNSPSNTPVSIDLGKTFKEKADIYPLLPFEGDIIYEGRWGNSIRFGSTVMASASVSPTDWSTTGVGENGDPIIIIRNGQGNQAEENKKPIIENINNDDASIYLTSTQNIPLDVSSVDYVSYNENPPVVPSQYAGSQILLNSGRLVFNSKSDHILLSSAKSINLNSQDSINIDTTKCILHATNIYLGTEELANQQLMLGNNTIDFLKDLMYVLREYTKLFKTIQTENTVDGKPAALPELRLKAILLDTTLQSLEKKLTLKESPLLSQRNYTL